MMNNGSAHTSVGAWLAAAALLLIAALALHPPPPAGAPAFMDLIADEGATWVVAHWIAAGALAAFVVTGLLALTAPASANKVPRSAWAILSVGALATMVTAVSEATAVSHVAAEGDLATFMAWERFAAGMSMGFVLMGLAFAGIAWQQARAQTPSVPRWSARVAALAGAVSSLAWVLVVAADVGPAGPVWLVSAVLVSLWLAWYGFSLMRAAAVPHGRSTHA